MRKIGIIFLVSCIILLTAVGFFSPKTTGQVCDEYIRIHVRADSNEGDAQAVKYAVRDALVVALAPIVAECESFEEAAGALKRSEQYLSRVGSETLKEKGFAYGARATVRKEYFPTRVYGEYTLPAGEYLALVVELGKAEGQNWWCVIYPPLCFAGEQGVPIRYKSRIAEIIQAWKEKK
jgi:stage II sporulation protein R